jgi:uncharacterized membrane protein
MLTFCNSYSKPIYVAYMFRSPVDCGEYGGWQTIGWFSINSGACSTVYANSLRNVNNRYWYYYAESHDRSYVWAGDVRVYVTDRRFDSCIGIGSTDARIVKFKKFDVGDARNFTMTLH